MSGWNLSSHRGVRRAAVKPVRAANARRRAGRAVLWGVPVLFLLLLAATSGRAQDAGAMIPTPQPDPAQPAAEAIVPLETEAPALPLLPASPAASRVLGVVDKPELVFLLQKAGLDARPLSYAQLEVGALDLFGLLMIDLEKPLSVAAAAFVSDFVARGGRLIACSWGAAVAPRRQAAFPAYRLLEALQVRVTGWSADGNAYLRAGDAAPLFRALPSFLDVRIRATPLIEPLASGRVGAYWVSEDLSRRGGSDVRSPAIVLAPRCAYFAPNVLAEALHSRQMLRLLINAISHLVPGLAPDPARLALAELEVVLGEARRVAAISQDPDAPGLLAVAEGKSVTAQALFTQPAGPLDATAALQPPVTGALSPEGEAGATGNGVVDAASAGAPEAAAQEGTSAPAVPSPDAGQTLAAIAEAIAASERVALLQIPCRTVEARGVLLPRRVLPPSRFAIGKLLDSLQAAGINLVFAEVYSAGQTLSPGPHQDPRFAGHNPLASLIAEAGPRGIAVHAWISLLTAGAPGQKGGILSTNARWAAQTRNGGRYVSGGEQWLCPSQVEPRDTVVQRIQQALANVPIQGVLLDGVDYGGLPEACYDPNCVALFRSDTGRNPREALKGEWEQEWLRWRRGRIDTLVRRVARAVRAQHPTVPLHLAVTAASADPRNNSLADWRTWIREGWIDGLCPHSGTGIAPTARKSTERVLRLAPGTRVMPIVDTARVRTARHAMTLVTALQEGGATGILFDLPQPITGAWCAELGRGSFRRTAALPW
ncbi:MAG TPA: family 10 glycosylhydrolase [Armatimonadota bacterium]|nr:family 10 glycosylhydrolase [Armatimonadota bacterium]